MGNPCAFRNICNSFTSLPLAPSSRFWLKIYFVLASVVAGTVEVEVTAVPVEGVVFGIAVSQGRGLCSVYPGRMEPAVDGAGVGASGVTAFDAVDAGLTCAKLLVAVAVKVYDVPFVRPVTVMGDELPVAVMLPGEEVTVYPVIPPPAEAVNDMVACALPAVATRLVGGITPNPILACANPR